MTAILTAHLRIVCFVAIFGATFTLLRAEEVDSASKVYAGASEAVFLLVAESDQGETVQGTGFLVDGGMIVTNAHVAKNGKVFVDLGPAKIPATIERLDHLNDLALLSTSVPLDARPLPLADDLPSPGASVYAIGNPAGLERTISTGIVSGLRDWDGRQLVQVTSPISAGSSGGPILDRKGKVVGVAVAVLRDGQNLNFAVPAPVVERFIQGEQPGNTAFTSDLVTSISPSQMRSILRGLGLRFEEDLSGELGFYEFEIDGIRVKLLYMLDGRVLVMQKVYGDTINAAQVNKWNQNSLFSLAYVNEIGNPYLESSLCLDGGISKEAIEAFIERFPSLVALFVEEMVAAGREADIVQADQVTSHHERSSSATQRVPAKEGDFAVWIDPANWKQVESDGDDRTMFRHSNGQLYGAFITEALPIPMDSLAEVALTNAREFAPKAKITAREMRIVNGTKVVALQIDCTAKGIPFRYYGYYYSGSSGNLQLITWTTVPAFELNVDELTTFLNGLEISDRALR